jgi:hypothetical protein
MTSTPHRPQHRRARPRRRVPVPVIVVAALVVLTAAGLAGWKKLSSSQSTGSNAVRLERPPPPTSSSTQVSTTAAAAVSTSPAQPITLSAVGDTVIGNTPVLPPDPSSYLDAVQSALAAQIVFGNLEGTLTNSTGSKCGPGSSQCYAFRTPPQYAVYLHNAGFTVINSANNHSHDFGAQGVADTSAALHAAGIVQAGLPGQIGIVHVGSTSVAFVDFAPYPYTNNLLDFAAAKALITQARTEAQIVVVYMHAGAEGSDADHVTGTEETFLGEDRGNAEAFAHAAIDDGANLVIASGPHVLRGMEFYKGCLIAYSLGNFASYHDFSVSGDLDLSGILKVSLDGHGNFVSGSFVSLVFDSSGRPQVDPSGAAARFVAQLSQEDFGPRAAVNTSGVISVPPGE